VADDHDARRKAHLRNTLIQHLQRCPFAGDTPDGMLACWLPPRGFEDAPHLIGAVVEAMVAAGELATRHLPDGRILYVRGPALRERA